MALSDLPPPSKKSSLSDLPPPTKTESKSESYYTPSEPFSIPSATEGALPDFPSIASSAYQTFKEYQPQAKKGMLLSPMGVVQAIATPQYYGQQYVKAEKELQDIEKEKQQLPAAERTIGEMLSPFPFAYTAPIEKVGTAISKAKLPKFLSETLGLTGKDLAKTLKEITTGKLSKETQEALAKGELAGKRAGAAEEIVKKQTDIPGAKYGELPGVEKETVAGKVIPLPESSQKQGSRVRDIVQNIFNKFDETRKTNATENFKNLFDFAYEKERQGLRLEDTKAFDKFSTEMKTLLRDPETGLANIPEGPIKQQILQIQRALEPIIEVGGEVIAAPKLSYKGMETLRRVLEDRALGLPAEGADAISQQLAGDLSKGIREILREFTVKNKGDVSLFDKAINDYKRDSEFLRAFNTKVGKALTEQQLLGEGFNIAKVSAQDIPKNVFKNKESFDVFVEALGGNEKLAQEEAKKYFANLMQGMNGQQLEKFITNDKNRQMLKLTGSYDMADAYTKSVKQAEKRVAGAGEKATSRRAIETEQKAFATELQTLQTDVNRATTIDEINSAAVKVVNTLADPKVGKLTVAQRDAILNNIKNITDLQKKKEQINKWIKWGFGGGGALGAYSIFSSRGQ
jgi:hypothetical protein